MRDDEVDDSGYDPNTEWWIKDLGLHATDQTVLTSGQELTENIINAAQKLLAQQFGNVKGFQPMYRSHYLNFEEVSTTTKSVQILHTGIYY